MKCFPPGQVNFTYFPVNHVDPATGAFECEDLDCPSTRYDGCMMDGLCYGRAGGCDAATQMKIAKFLACFEGPFANTEREVNASRREPCFLEAGLDFAPVRTCYEDAERADAIAARLNASKAAMMARLGPDPGYFPHIFVDGEALVNRTWCALTRALCRAIGPEPVPRVGLGENVMVVGIYRRPRAQLGQLRALLLGAVGQMLNGGAVIRAREVLLQSFDQFQKSIHGRIAVGVGVELKSGAPKHLTIGA